MSIIIILGVALFIGPSPELKTVVGSKHERIKFIYIVDSSRIIIEVCSHLLIIFVSVEICG